MCLFLFLSTHGKMALCEFKLKHSIQNHLQYSFTNQKAFCDLCDLYKNICVAFSILEKTCPQRPQNNNVISIYQ